MNNFICKKHLKSFSLGIIFFGIFVFLLGINIVKGEGELQIFFSGTLLDKQELPAESAYYNMQFSIYETSTSTDSLWKESFIGEDKVWIENGRFRVVLGLKNPVELNFENTKYWLAVSVGGVDTEPIWDEEMTPRIPITTLKNLLLEGIIDIGEEDQIDFIEALLKEFEGNATSSEGLSQRAFLRFLQEKISASGVNAVIISPETLNLLLEEVFNLQETYEQEEGLEAGIWQKVLTFFKRILDAISEKLIQISEKISEIFTKLVNIELGINKILSILDKKDSQQLTEVNQEEEQEPSASNNDSNDQEAENSNVESLSSFVEDSGQATIPSGAKTVRIFSNYVAPESKIFISLRSPISGIWWISEKKEGEFFEVSILVPVEENLIMDYWIIAPESTSLEEDTPSEQPEANEGTEKLFEGGIEPIEEQPEGTSTPEQEEQSSEEEASDIEGSEAEESPESGTTTESVSSSQSEYTPEEEEEEEASDIEGSEAEEILESETTTESVPSSQSEYAPEELELIEPAPELSNI